MLGECNGFFLRDFVRSGKRDVDFSQLLTKQRRALYLPPAASTRVSRESRVDSTLKQHIITTLMSQSKKYGDRIFTSGFITSDEDHHTL